LSDSNSELNANTFLMQAYPGQPGLRAVKRVSCFFFILFECGFDYILSQLKLTLRFIMYIKLLRP